MTDLLDKAIDYRTNVLGNLFLERGHFGLIQGLTSIGKSVMAAQIGVEAGCGRNTFGIKTPTPLRTLLVQAEDSTNDRRSQITGVVNGLQLPVDERHLVGENFRIITPERRADRGQALFEYLRAVLKEVELDLIMFNPAFSFIDGNMNSPDVVGDFLRNHLQEFCRDKDCAGLVFHHNPKPPKSGKGRGADTTAYSGSGSAEWANASRAVITVDRTMVNWVFEFTIGKRGSHSGWARDRSGDFRRYFVHSRTNLMFWDAASEADIAAANNGIAQEELVEVFKGDADLDLETLKRRFKHYGYSFQEEDELMDLLANLVERDKLTTTIHDGGVYDGMQTWRAVRHGKARETFESKKDTAIFFIEEAMPNGIITSELRNKVPYGHSVLDKVLNALLEEGKIVRFAEGSNAIRYFLKGT
jgi:AAA domain